MADATSHYHALAANPPPYAPADLPPYNPANDPALQNADHITILHTTVHNYHTFAEDSAQSRTASAPDSTLLEVLFCVVLIVISLAGYLFSLPK